MQVLRIDTKPAGKAFKRTAVVRDLIQLLLSGYGFRFRAANDDRKARQDADRVRVAAIFAGPLLDVGVIGACLLDDMLNAEDRLSIAGRKVTPLLRPAGLHQQGPPLRRARQLQRSLYGEQRAFVVDAMDQVAIGEDAAAGVVDQRLVLP